MLIRNLLGIFSVWDLFLGYYSFTYFILWSRSKLRIKKEMEPIITAVTSLSQGQNVVLKEKEISLKLRRLNRNISYFGRATR